MHTTTVPHPSSQPPSSSSLPPQDWHLQNLKRRYLTLLPPPQIVEICLAFEPHAPLHVQSAMWPADLSASIAALESLANNLAPPLGDAPPSTAQENPPMASLTPPESSNGSTAHDPATERVNDAAVATVSASQPVASQPANDAAPAPYPHFPYPLPHHAYMYPPYHSGAFYAPPHTPFPSYLSHPHPPPPPFPPGASHGPFLPYYPPSTSGSYPPNSHQKPPPLPPQMGPPFSIAPVLPDPLPLQDDLPSYEEMIVEAIIDIGEPDGCVPKALFNWMASHYPLQSNFRPSASQALQKAYKRGRLEKRPGGKYRLNALWGGGNTSRRATRRPQTQTSREVQSLPVQGAPVDPPFTHSPLHRDQPSHGGGPFPIAYVPLPSAAPIHISTGGDTLNGNDAWSAAQAILKAINFGGLLERMSNQGDTLHETARAAHPAAAMIGERAELQTQLALLAAQLTEIAAADGE